jgi:hypothetical protein
MSSGETRVSIGNFAANFSYERGKNAIHPPAAAVATVTEITTTISMSIVEDTSLRPLWLRLGDHIEPIPAILALASRINCHVNV